MIIKNGLVFGEYGTFTNRDLVVDSNHKIADVPEPEDNEIIDAEGLYVIPDWWMYTSTAPWDMISAMATARDLQRFLPI